MYFALVGRNEPLKKDKPKWKSEYPMTEGQLRSKRDEFWDTAPAFDGRKEIWDALKAAAVATECNDHELAQAIVDGASITLPHGKHLNSILIYRSSENTLNTSVIQLFMLQFFYNYHSIGFNGIINAIIIQQNCVKLIKSDSKNIYNVTIFSP